jgi:membrane peptidoglycan carboxypeptidase
VFNPLDNYKIAKFRQGLVLDRMEELGWATSAEVKAARKAPIKLGKGTSYTASQVPYVTQAVSAELVEKFGQDLVLKGGLRVQTTIDLKLQRLAEQAIKKGHQDLQNYGTNASQIALVSVDPKSGFVKALVGGAGSFEQNQFNRAVQARRQIGSTFKPFVFYSAFATGNYNPDSIVNDSPVSYPDGNEMYSPRNYDNTFMGGITIRQAVAISRNIPAISLGQSVGIKRVIADCRKMGIMSPLSPVVSLPLGSADLTLIETAGAYATFANGGYKNKITLISFNLDGK